MFLSRQKIGQIVHITLFVYRITGNFCGFGLKRRHLIFVDFFVCRLKISVPKKKWFVLQEATTEAMKDSIIILQ